jgi:hypothetical protein
MDTNIDKELIIMREAYQLLKDVDESTQERIIAWLQAKLGTTHGESKPVVATSKPDELPQLGNLSQQDAVLLVVASLLKYSPRLSVTAREINSKLAELNYKVGHLTRALTLLAQQRPALLLLIKKGYSKQAQREIKLTAAGVRRALKLGRS